MSEETDRALFPKLPRTRRKGATGEAIHDAYERAVRERNEARVTIVALQEGLEQIGRQAESGFKGYTKEAALYELASLTRVAIEAAGLKPTDAR